MQVSSRRGILGYNASRALRIPADSEGINAGLCLLLGHSEEAGQDGLIRSRHGRGRYEMNGVKRECRFGLDGSFGFGGVPCDDGVFIFRGGGFLPSSRRLGGGFLPSSRRQ